MKRTEVLNYLIAEKGYKSYLEIGTQKKSQNFNQIKIKDKYCIDPNPNAEADYIGTSDEFFAMNKDTYDIIFIDGDHSHEQSLKDFHSAINCINKGGVIVFHDAMPHNLEYTQPHWCGQVYKTCLIVSTMAEVRTYQKDHGVCVVWADTFVNERKVIDLSYDYQKLWEQLNAVNDFEDLLVDYQEEPVEEVKTFDDRDALEAMQDKTLKEAYKNKTGKKRVAKSVTREDMIEAILS
jgi:hypothetical protein